MNKYKQLLKNLFMLFAGSFVTRILSFFLVPFYTSILTTNEYGIADLVTNVVFVFLPIFSLLMEEAVMRFSLDKTTNKKEILTISLKISTIGFLCMLFFSPMLLLFDNLKAYYWYVIAYYFVSWLYNIFFNYIKGINKIEIITIVGVIQTVLYFILNIYFLAILKMGIHGYLSSIILSSFIAICFIIYFGKLYKESFNLKKTDWELAKKMIKYSLPMIPNYILWWINNASDRFLITFFCGVSVNGIYSVAFKIPSLLNSVTAIFASAWRISSVEDFGSEESIKFYNKVYSFYSGILFIGASSLILISKFLAYILYSKDFFEAWRITPFLILAYVFSALAQYLNSIFLASKQTKVLIYSSFFGAIINVILNIILIPKFLGIGAAIATLIGYITIWIINMKNTKKILAIDFNLKSIIFSFGLIIIEITFILLNYSGKYIIAIVCILGVILLNQNPFYNMFNVIKLKFLKYR